MYVNDMGLAGITVTIFIIIMIIIFCSLALRYCYSYRTPWMESMGSKLGEHSRPIPLESCLTTGDDNDEDDSKHL